MDSTSYECKYKVLLDMLKNTIESNDKRIKERKDKKLGDNMDKMYDAGYASCNSDFRTLYNSVVNVLGE